MSDYNHSDRLGSASDRFQSSSPSHHQDADRARKAAEALFVAKGPIANTPAPDSTEPAQQARRKPRILSAMREELSVIEAAEREPTKPPLTEYERARPRKRIPVSNLPLVRTWLKYGMTVRQAAEVCGVSVSEIERIMLKG